MDTPAAPPARREAARRALCLDAAALLAQCDESFFVASGPGGQHRNKTESGVRLTHPATELSVTATERRSQHQNRGVALERPQPLCRILHARRTIEHALAACGEHITVRAAIEQGVPDAGLQ